jgi:hypothetical protein
MEKTEAAWAIVERHFQGGFDALTKGIAVRMLKELGYSENFASTWIDEVWQERFGKEEVFTVRLAEWQYNQLMFILESAADEGSNFTTSEQNEAWSLLEHVQDEVAENMQV